MKSEGLQEKLDYGFDKWYLEHREDLIHFLPDLEDSQRKILFRNAFTEGALVTAQEFNKIIK